jgi:hypothetical protein
VRAITVVRGHKGSVDLSERNSVLFGSVNAGRHRYELAAAALRPEDIKTALACRDGAP